MGGFSNHFPFKTSGMDRIKNWACKEEITRNLGLTARLVTLLWSCQPHTLSLFSILPVNAELQMKSNVLLELAKWQTKPSASSMDVFTDRVISTGTGQTQNRCWYYRWTYYIYGNVCLAFFCCSGQEWIMKVFGILWTSRSSFMTNKKAPSNFKPISFTGIQSNASLWCPVFFI